MPDMTPGVPSALSPLVRRIVAPNPGPMTGPGTNTYLVGIDEVAVIDPGPDTKKHIDAIVGASMRERVRWVVLTHTHPDHAPGTARLDHAFSNRDSASAVYTIDDSHSNTATVLDPFSTDLITLREQVFSFSIGLSR